MKILELNKDCKDGFSYGNQRFQFDRLIMSYSDRSFWGSYDDKNPSHVLYVIFRGQDQNRMNACVDSVRGLIMETWNENT